MATKYSNPRKFAEQTNPPSPTAATTDAATDPNSESSLPPHPLSLDPANPQLSIVATLEVEGPEPQRTQIADKVLNLVQAAVNVTQQENPGLTIVGTVGTPDLTPQGAVEAIASENAAAAKVESLSDLLDRDMERHSVRMAIENADEGPHPDINTNLLALIAARVEENNQYLRISQQRGDRVQGLVTKALKFVDTIDATSTKFADVLSVGIPFGPDGRPFPRSQDAHGGVGGRGVGGPAAQGADGGAAVGAAVPDGGRADDVSKPVGRVDATTLRRWTNRAVRVYGWLHSQMKVSEGEPQPSGMLYPASICDPWTFQSDPADPSKGLAVSGNFTDLYGKPGPIIVNHEHELTPGGLMAETVTIVDLVRKWTRNERRIGVYGVPCASLYPDQEQNVRRWNAQRRDVSLFSRVDFLCVNGYWDRGMNLTPNNGGGVLYQQFCQRAALDAALCGKPILICVSHRTPQGDLVEPEHFAFMLAAIRRAFEAIPHLLEGVAFFVGNTGRKDANGNDVPDSWGLALPYAKQARAWADALNAEAGPFPTYAREAAPAGPVSQ